jgi:hypothetical protein
LEFFQQHVDLLDAGCFFVGVMGLWLAQIEAAAVF